MRAECSSIPAQTSVSWRRLVLMSLTVGVLAGLTVAAARAAARATSGTFDETIYLDLARRAWFEHHTEGFTELGVAPLPVMLAWSRAAVEPFDQASGDPAVYTNRVARARNNAIWWFAVPLVVSVFLWLAVTVLTVVAGVAILVTGRYPRSIFDFNVGVMRWTWRVSYYAVSAFGTPAKGAAAPDASR